MTEQAIKGRLGDRLIARGLLSKEKLQVALGEQRRFHRPLGQILISLGFVSQKDLALCLAEDLGLAFMTAEEVQPDPLVLTALDPSFVRETLSFPYALEGGVLKVVMVDPDNPRKVSEVRARFPYSLELAITTESDLLTLVRAHLQVRTSRVAEILAEAQKNSGRTESYPVEAIAHAIITDGVNRNATDIHIEPEDLVTRVRYRVDGILQNGENLPHSVTAAVISRIKVLSHLDISERRRPQDGRLRMDLDDREMDMRVSIMPTNYGENLVLRILEKSGGVLKLGHLGISSPHQAVLKNIVDRPHGLFLVTGPTGSGKTTTLYAMLSVVDAMHRKVATVEDPIEYRLPLLRQTQVDPSIGFTFEAGLRSLLRQDPDVILVGEIRDQETADMALKASMTGHLVLSTLHTNSAVGAVPRLVDMGIEPYLVEDSLIGAMSQRLVRRVCTSCSEELPATDEELAWLEEETLIVRHGRGCERCDLTGYQGRTAAVELFLPDARIAEAMRTGESAGRLEELACETGLTPMYEDGKRLVREGVTTMEEVLRVSRKHRLTKEEREGI